MEREPDVEVVKVSSGACGKSDGVCDAIFLPGWWGLRVLGCLETLLGGIEKGKGPTAWRLLGETSVLVEHRAAPDDQGM